MLLPGGIDHNSYPSDYTSLTINISISQEFIQEKQHTIIRNNKEEEKFVINLKNAIGNIDTSNISSNEFLGGIIQEYASISDSIWYKISEMSILLSAPKYSEMRSATPNLMHTDPPNQ